jgi:hypothetical protein
MWLIAGLSVTFTKELTKTMKINFKISGGDLMNGLMVMTSGLAVSTGLCGVCSSYKVGN